jgi:hypothetical protein
MGSMPNRVEIAKRVSLQVYAPDGHQAEYRPSIAAAAAWLAQARANDRRSGVPVARSRLGRPRRAHASTIRLDPIRRKILKTGAAATVMAAAPRVFAQKTSFYKKGPVRIHYRRGAYS